MCFVSVCELVERDWARLTGGARTVPRYQMDNKYSAFAPNLGTLSQPNTIPQTLLYHDTMDQVRQHLEYDEIPPDSRTNLENLRDATEAIDEDGWVIDATVDKLNEKTLEKLLPIVTSLVKSCKVATFLPHSKS